MSCCSRPPYAQIEPGWQDGWPSSPLPVVADQWNEYINLQLPQGVFLVTVPFSVNKASAQIVFHGIGIENTVDTTQVVPGFNIVGRTIAGFTIMLDQQVDSNNYFLKGLVSVIA